MPSKTKRIPLVSRSTDNSAAFEHFTSKDYLTADELRGMAMPERVEGVEFTATELEGILHVSNFARWVRRNGEDLWDHHVARVGSRCIMVYRRRRA